MGPLCNICSSETKLKFEFVLLRKYMVKYFNCKTCGFIQTEKPYWLTEAYASAITDLDIGLLYRNTLFSDTLENILLKDVFDEDGKFIDYGGGYGIFVRIMRDKGFDFYRQDLHCQNLFAKHFDISDIIVTGKFELLTAFEVFEHLEDPMSEIEKMLSYSDNILFSTELVPDTDPNPTTWWYFTPETGQHISFFTMESLEILADRYGLRLYSNGTTLHLFTKKVLNANPFLENSRPAGRIKRFLSLFKNASNQKRESLLQKDFKFIRDLINERQN